MTKFGRSGISFYVCCMARKSIIVYASYINRIGGIETFIHNFAKRLSPYYDITVLFKEADAHQLGRLLEHARLLRFTGQSLKCDYFIQATAWGVNPEKHIGATKYIQMVHADYGAYIKDWNFTYTRGERTTHHVAVGQHVARQFEKTTGYKADAVIHNLL